MDQQYEIQAPTPYFVSIVCTVTITPPDSSTFEQIYYHPVNVTRANAALRQTLKKEPPDSYRTGWPASISSDLLEHTVVLVRRIDR